MVADSCPIERVFFFSFARPRLPKLGELSCMKRFNDDETLNSSLRQKQTKNRISEYFNLGMIK